MLHVSSGGAAGELNTCYWVRPLLITGRPRSRSPLNCPKLDSTGALWDMIGLFLAFLIFPFQYAEDSPLPILFHTFVTDQ